MVYENIPLTIATFWYMKHMRHILKNKPNHSSFSPSNAYTIGIIDKNTNCSIRINTLKLYTKNKNNHILLNLSREEFEKYRNLNKKNLAQKNEINYITENDIFNRFFDVYTNDLNKAKSFLTPELLEFIAKFRVKYKVDFEILIKDKIYIRLFKSENRLYSHYKRNLMFDEKIMFSKDGDNISAIQYYVITKFIKEFVEKIK